MAHLLYARHIVGSFTELVAVFFFSRDTEKRQKAFFFIFLFNIPFFF